MTKHSQGNTYSLRLRGGVEAGDEVARGRVEAVRAVRRGPRGGRRQSGRRRDDRRACRRDDGWGYAVALCGDPDATPDDLHEAVTTLEDSERIARRVLGPANPATAGIEISLRNSRAVLAARETSPTSNNA